MIMKTNVEFDLTKENPLVTILKNGYIPVAKICFRDDDKEFKNEGLFDFYKKIKIDFYDLNGRQNKGINLKNIPSEGCFGYVGGVYGFDLDSFEPFYGIKFCALKPETFVLNTYTDKRDSLKSLEKITAKEKYLYCLNKYNYLKDFIDRRNNLKEYEKGILLTADYTRKIIFDEKDIEFSYYLSSKDFPKLMDISFDGFLNLSQFDNFVTSIFDFGNIPLPVINSYGFSFKEFEDKDNRIKFIDSVLYDSVQREIAIKALKEYTEEGEIKTFLSEYIKERNILMDKKDEFVIDKLSFYSENFMGIQLSFKTTTYFRRDFKISLDVCNNKSTFHISGKEGKGLETFSDLFSIENKEYVYKISKVYMDISNIIKKYLPDYIVCKDVEMLYELYLLEQDFQNIGYISDGKYDIVKYTSIDKDFNIVFNFTNLISVYYNIPLNDFIVKIFDTFYNLDKLDNISTDLKDVVRFTSLDVSSAILYEVINNSKFFNNSYKKTFLKKINSNNLYA